MISRVPEFPKPLIVSGVLPMSVDVQVNHGAPYGWPVALNNAGQAIGTDYISTREGEAQHGVLWQRR